jgi:hypothetical protein
MSAPSERTLSQEPYSIITFRGKRYRVWTDQGGYGLLVERNQATLVVFEAVIPATNSPAGEACLIMRDNPADIWIEAGRATFRDKPVFIGFPEPEPPVSQYCQ